MEIAVLAGGNSSEHEISVKSGTEVLTWLKNAGYSAHLVIIKNDNWQVLYGDKSYPFDKVSFSFKAGSHILKCNYAWNSIHGHPGENGILSAYLDLLGIPYNCSGHLSSAMSFNKYVAKNYLKQFGIPTAEADLIHKNKTYDLDEIIEKVGLPCFIKPNNGGSSFGTTKVTHSDQLLKAIKLAMKEDNQVIAESFLKGREFTCGMFKTSEEETIFPITEIISKNEFFDYQAKYEGLSDEITPADIDIDIAKRISQLASEIYSVLQCRGLVRIDFIIKGNQIYFLELNTIPGMSKESIVPQQVDASGSTMESIFRKIIADTSN